MSSPTRNAVEQAVQSLSTKIISACEDNRPQEAQAYANALNDTTWGLEHIAEAEAEEPSE